MFYLFIQSIIFITYLRCFLKKIMLFFNKNVSFGGGGAGQLSNGLFFLAEFYGQLLTAGKFRPGLIVILTRQLSTTKVL